MTGTLAPWFYQQLFGLSGEVLAGGEIATYEAGTTTPAETWSQSDLIDANLNSNPIVLDGSGFARIYLQPGNSYKFKVYDAGGNLLRTVDNIAAVGLAATPTSNRGTCQGRLTLESMVPVPSTDILSAQTLYFTPDGGDGLALYDGTQWLLYNFSELSYSLTALLADTAYDVYASAAGDVLSLETQAWPGLGSTPARGTQDGVLVMNGDATRRLLGSILMTSVAGRAEDSLLFRGVSNLYNTVPRAGRMLGAATWAYTSPTIRQANGSVASQVTVFNCVGGRSLQARLNVTASNPSATVNRSAGIGLNVTSAYATGCLHTSSAPATSVPEGIQADLVTVLIAGLSVVAWLEQSEATGTTTWIGADTYTQSGLTTVLEA